MQKKQCFEEVITLNVYNRKVEKSKINNLIIIRSYKARKRTH